MHTDDRTPWHNKGVDAVLRELRSSPEGISHEEARTRLSEYGPNELIEKKKKSPFMMFLGQFRDFMILILLAAALISGLIGDLSDTIAIVVIVVLNAAIGFLQEYRAEKAMTALKKMATPSAKVTRQGMPLMIAATELVPGDIVILETGMVVPADLRIIHSARLSMGEASLTGESFPVEKHTEALYGERVQLGDRANMAYKGTFVSSGRGAGIVTGTGMNTELGQIAAMLQKARDPKTPLQRRLAVFGRMLALVVLLICAIVFGVGVTRGEQPLLMLLTAISLAVAAIPEALPAVITITLALGARKLAAQNALIRNLPAVETLGSVTFICSDKTGTLTLNKMIVDRIFLNGKFFRPEDLKGMGFYSPGSVDIDEPASAQILGMALCNDSQTDASGNMMGDPTEIALLEAVNDMGISKKELEKAFPRIAEIPFDSDRKCMTTVHSTPDGGYISFTKGAIESLVERSAKILTSGGALPFDPAEIRRINETMSLGGLRVLGVAIRKWEGPPDSVTASDMETGLTLLSLVGMTDPPREDAGAAVSVCRTAGITPVMITGDHPITATAIARSLGIIIDDREAVVTGGELDRLSDRELYHRADRLSVYARVAPAQKARIVKALQERGECVAMTGDGVNDSPALKNADIGVAMGITGTDVAKEAADMILLDDNFATIINAVKEGRKIFDNIRKFIKYLLTTNSGEIWTLFLAPFAGLPVPLLPIHILWINLVTDSLPALALSAEPADADIMNRPPRDPQESIFARGLGLHAIWVGLLMGGTVLLIQALAIRTGHVHWQTMVFSVLCLSQLGHVLAIRSEKESLFRIGLLSNKYLFGAVAMTAALQMCTIYVPALNPVFKTAPLSPGELVITLASSSAVFFAVEIEKFVKRRNDRQSPVAGKA